MSVESIITRDGFIFMIVFEFILILCRFAAAKLLRMSYAEGNNSIKFANQFRLGINRNLLFNL